MLTKLPKSITTFEEAKVFLSELHRNQEDFHPEEDANNIHWVKCASPTFNEAIKLNELMQQIYDLPGNDGRHTELAFDPCEFLSELDSNNSDLLEDDPHSARIADAKTNNNYPAIDSPATHALKYIAAWGPRAPSQYVWHEMYLKATSALEEA
jgi:hypothetical protein